MLSSTETIISNISTFLPSWSNLSPSAYKLTPLAGCSNQVFKLEQLSQKIIPSTLIYRQFAKTNDFVESETEEIVFYELGKQGIGPLSYGFSKEYRLEEFLFGVHPLNHEMLEKNFIGGFAKIIAKLHSSEMPIKNKSPMMKSFLNGKNGILNKIQEILQKEQNEKNEKIGDLMEFCEKEREFLLNLLPKNDDSVCFCHNDLNPTNIIVGKCGSFHLIDCEYGAYNYRGFDIAFFFMEIAFDYNEFPKVVFRKELLADEKIIEEFCKFYVFYRFYDKYEGTMRDLVKELCEEVKFGMLLCLFFTCFWNVYQVRNSKIDFDFLWMAREKQELYRKYKEENLKV